MIDRIRYALDGLLCRRLRLHPFRIYGKRDLRGPTWKACRRCTWGVRRVDGLAGESSVWVRLHGEEA